MTIIQDSPNTLWIRNARLSFPELLVPKASTATSKPRYAANFIMEPDAPEFGEMEYLKNEMFKEKWGDNAANIGTMIANNPKLRCYGFGQEKISTKTGQVHEGYEGKVFIRAARREDEGRPAFYGQNAQEAPPTAPLNQWFTGGNYVDGIVSFWLQENEHGRAFRCSLIALQYVKEGKHFGADEVTAAGIFQPVAGAPAPTASAPGMTPPPMGAPPAMPTAPAAPGAIDPLS